MNVDKITNKISMLFILKNFYKKEKEILELNSILNKLLYKIMKKIIYKVLLSISFNFCNLNSRDIDFLTGLRSPYNCSWYTGLFEL